MYISEWTYLWNLRHTIFSINKKSSTNLSTTYNTSHLLPLKKNLTLASKCFLGQTTSRITLAICHVQNIHFTYRKRRNHIRPTTNISVFWNFYHIMQLRMHWKQIFWKQRIPTTSPNPEMICTTCVSVD